LTLSGVVLIVVLFSAGCSKPAMIAGNLVERDGTPIPGVTIRAISPSAENGVAVSEAVTDSEGGFLIGELQPNSSYRVEPYSQWWTTDSSVEVRTGELGSTRTIPQDLMIEYAVSEKGKVIDDYSKGTERYSTSADGTITDSRTGLEWRIAPDPGQGNFMKFWQAEQFVERCGPGWRLPTRDELAKLHFHGLGESNVDPAFATSRLSPWTSEEPDDEYNRFVWLYDLQSGESFKWPKDGYNYPYNAFAVHD
jgi:hypothetical protein